MKLSIKKFTTFAGFAACLALPWSAQGAWTLIQDFEGLAEGNYIKNGVPDLIYPISHNGGQGEMDVYSKATTGIEGIGGQNAAYFWFGVINANAGDVWHFIPLPNPIEVNTTGTVYFRLWQLSYDCNYHFGFTQIEAGTQPDGVAAWGSMASILRYDAPEPQQMDAHTGATYANSYPTWLPEIATWYEYWMVIDNSWDTSVTPAALTGGWQMYRKGPTDAEPVIMAWGTETDNFTKLGFRNKSASSMKSFWLSQTGFAAAGSPNPYLIDDLWQYNGANLNTPPEEGSTTWCGYNVVPGDYVDTGSWMDWVYVGAAPGGAPGWIYSVNLNDWVYAAGCPGDGGTWVYIPN